VIGVDNFRTGKRGNLCEAERNSAFRLVETDIAVIGCLDELVAEMKPDAIVHLAALVSVQESIARPDLNFLLNVQASQFVAEAARRHSVKRVVFASSAAVYGDTRQLPLTEHSITRPISPYGAAKLASEALLLGHAQSFGFVTRLQRYFNVYGPRQDPHSPYSGVISVFCDRFHSGLSSTIFGDGEQTRDFIFVGDVARANVLAATAERVSSGIANICTGHSTTLNRLATILSRRFERAPSVAYGPAKPADIRYSLGAPGTAENEFGFTAAVTLEEGLLKLLQHERSRNETA